MNTRTIAGGRLGLLLTFSLLLAACGASASTSTPRLSPGTTQHAHLAAAGLDRTYRLFQPKSLNPKEAPALVVVLHGCPPGATSGDQVATLTHFDDAAITSRFVVAYPDGIDGCWNSGPCCGAADDITFISHLIDRIVTELPINKQRVFVAGFSGGGALSQRIACELSTKVAAIASVGGTLLTDCRPAYPVSILELHGTADDAVPLEGGVHGMPSFSIPSIVRHWAVLDGCTGDPASSQSGITKTTVWKSCKAGTVVRLDAIEGGHHTWFGSVLNPVPGEPNASAVVSDFFNAATGTPDRTAA